MANANSPDVGDNKIAKTHDVKIGDKRAGETMRNDENNNERIDQSMVTSSLKSNEGGDVPLLQPACEVIRSLTSDAPKRFVIKTKTLLQESPESKKNIVGQGQLLYGNNNNCEESIAESKAAFLNKLFYGTNNNIWKNERGAQGDWDPEANQLKL